MLINYNCFSGCNVNSVQFSVFRIWLQFTYSFSLLRSLKLSNFALEGLNMKLDLLPHETKMKPSCKTEIFLLKFF